MYGKFKNWGHFSELGLATSRQRGEKSVGFKGGAGAGQRGVKGSRWAREEGEFMLGGEPNPAPFRTHLPFRDSDGWSLRARKWGRCKDGECSGGDQRERQCALFRLGGL